MERKPIIDWQNVFLILFVFMGFVACFGAGVMIQRLFGGSEVGITGPIPLVTPTPTLTEIPDSDVVEVQPGTGLEKDRVYFDDTVMLVSKEEPRRVLVASVVRNDQGGGVWQQNSRVSIFDGEKWTRKIVNGTSDGPNIVSGSLVKSWKIDFDSSRVLKQTVKGEVIADGKPISFDTGILTNEIGMRSLPGYTKFMSYGEGVMVWGGKKIPSRLVYTRIYSMNSSEIQFYTGNLGLTTDWIAFWDSEGNFYHVDKTSVDKPTEIYKTHQIAVLEDFKNKSVSKSFVVEVNRDEQTPPEKYEVNISDPIDASLSLVRGAFIDKAPSSAYKWFMGVVSGSVRTKDGEKEGFGVEEYIRD